MKNRNKKIKTSLFCLSTLFFLSFVSLLATKEAIAQTYSVSIWPPLSEIMIKPGKSVTQIFRIGNAGDEQVLTAKIMPFEPADSQGNINLLNLTSLLNPLTFSFEGSKLSLGKAFTVKSGETVDQVLKIFVPFKTPEKDFYFSLVFETNPSSRVGISRTQTAVKIASNILLTVSTTEKPEKRGKILAFSAPRIVDSFDEVPFTLEVQNIGRTFFKPFGKISIEGILNQKATIKLLPENILSGFSRALNVPPWKEKFILGPFRAKVEFNLDEETDNLVAETTFIALPYKGILVLILVLIILESITNLPQKVSKALRRLKEFDNEKVTPQ